MNSRHLARSVTLAATTLVALCAMSVAAPAAEKIVPKATVTSCYVVDHKWGSEGTAAGEFGGSPALAGGPDGVLVDRDAYTVYVTDPGNARIQVFGSEGNFIKEIIRKDKYGNPAWSPIGPIAEDVQGNLYMITAQYTTVTVPWWPGWAKTEAFTVHKIDPSHPKTDIATFEVPLVYDYSRLGEPIIRNLVTGIAVDPHGNVFVCDGGANRVLKFDPDLGYALVATWAKNGIFPGSGQRQFDFPTGVACDRTGHVFVLDDDNHRVQKLNAMTGAFISQWGKPGIAPGMMDTGMSIACDLQGNVYVGEGADIQRFTNDGTFITRWGSLNTGSGPGQLDDVTGISVAGSGDVFAADCFNYAVKDFKPFADTVGPKTSASAKITTHKGDAVTFKFSVRDAHSMDAFVTIKIKKGTTVVKKIGPFWKLADGINYWPWTCTLGKGKYAWYVYAKDLSGNAQQRPVGNQPFIVN